MVRKIGEYKDDDGIIVAELWETNKGDTYYTGNIPPEGAGFTEYIGMPFETPGGVISDDDFPDPPSQQAQTFDHNTDSKPDTNQDSEMKTGQEKQDGDSDSTLSGKIADNTAATADNTKRLGDYAADLRSAVNSMDRNQSLQTQMDKDRDTRAAEDEATASAGKGVFDGINVSQYYNDGNYSGDLVVGTDYDEVGPLGDEEWVQTIAGNNAVKTALESSGFTMSGETCEATLSLGYLGTHQMSLCEFDSEFRKAGVLLLSIVSLGTLVLVIRG